MRRTLAVTLAVLVWAAFGGQPAWSATCPEPQRSYYMGEVEVEADGSSLTVPGRLAYGRRGAVKVSSPVTSPPTWEAGHLEYVDASGRVLFEHALTPEELAHSKTPSASIRFPPLRVTAATGSVLVRFSFRARDPSYEPYCDFTLEQTVRAFPGVSPRLVTEDNEHGWRGYVYNSIFELKPDDCEAIRPGRLRIILRHHGRKRVLVAGRSCSAGWSQAGRLMPGLRLGSGLAWDGGLSFDAVGRRSWTRSYQVDVSWNGTRIARRWLRIVHRVYPAHRIYEDSDSFEESCGETSGEDAPPIYNDPKRGDYCVAPRYSNFHGRVLTRRPG
jgi:hypothetical protein